MVLDAALRNTQHYKVRIKDKVEPSRKRSCLPHLDVVSIKKEAFGSTSTKVANFTYTDNHIISRNYLYLIIVI